LRRRRHSSWHSPKTPASSHACAGAHARHARTRPADGGWLDARYAHADAPTRATFDALLDESDPDLWDWLIARGEPRSASRRSSMKSAPSIAFDYAPSRLVFAALCVVAGLAAAAPWFSALPVVIGVVLSLLVVGCATMAAVRSKRRRSCASPIAVTAGCCSIALAASMRRRCARTGISARS
jgi:hypothetical protein